MKVHHINCATMCPVGGRLVGGSPGSRPELVCHCLLVETDAGLVLVDTGLGREDLDQPKARLGRPFVRIVRPALEPTETARHQVEQLGFGADDVRHILVTHLDLDHAGGLPDFPKAKVHLYEPEHAGAMLRKTARERRRYSPAHWAHGPNFVAYQIEGEHWFGFECVRELDGLPPEILLVPLVGHSRGHAAVAVDTTDGWLLHCGDAYFYRGEVEPDPHCPWGLRVFQSLVEHDGKARRRNQQRLRELAQEHADEVRLFCAHDRFELDAFT